ncbi:UbiH/UbiF family hydroxylase [Shimia ponticola]|uniref:UbiH/UbiF family hydroxylase n=1 Tax=Shimia ponticola TaxID=2582893 RepID=UPI0011BDE16B|nr:UbiH/UbiF family hydroxylase [Shimia ponticola]
MTDILISGGGVAGLTAAAAFGTAGFDVLCVDPAPPVTDRDADGADLRTTAFLQPAQRFLEEAGVWAHLAPHSAGLQVMRIVDAGGTAPTARATRDFDAADISDAPFGYNLPNWLIRKALLDRLEELPNVTFRTGVGVSRLTARTSEAKVALCDGDTVTARLVIAADGRNSPCREALGIGVTTHDFRQMALTFAVAHEGPHDNVSTEVHRTGGPFTLVPLPDYQGKPSSAVVWMETEENAKALLALDEDAFNAAATERSAGVLGSLTLISRRTTWPIISQVAHQFYGPRTALVAEAAHVMPPIGAQGLNTSLKDLQALLDLCRDAPESIGDETMLRKYHRARFADVAGRTLGVSVLNKASIAAPQPLRDARAAGLRLIHDVKPVRTALMRLGLGV